MSMCRSKYVCRVVLALTVFGLLVTLPAQAAPVIGVANSYHNLSTSAPDIYAGFNPYRSTNVSEICVFCHTPHSSNPQGPLWNRANPDPTGFSMYTSARTGSATTAGRDVSPESLLCLSCHDGSIATNAIINKGAEGASVPEGFDPAYVNIVSDGASWSAPAIIGARIGAGMQDDGTLYAVDTGHLEDDHPISMDMATSKLAFDAEFKTVADAKLAGARFFGATDSYVECSSCHDPHINYLPAAGGDAAYAPFLVMPNTNSDLCYACHTK